MARHGVRVGQNLVLAALWEDDGLTPGDVARRLGVRTPTVVKMATRMEAAGLLERRRDAKDARLVRLHLTRKGRSLQVGVEDELEALEDRALATMSDREKRQLQRSMQKIVDNLGDVTPMAESEDELP